MNRSKRWAKRADALIKKYDERKNVVFTGYTSEYNPATYETEQTETTATANVVQSSAGVDTFGDTFISSTDLMLVVQRSIDIKLFDSVLIDGKNLSIINSKAQNPSGLNLLTLVHCRA